MTKEEKKYQISPRILLVVIAAVLMGFISGKFLFNGSMLNIIPWGVLAQLTAIIAINKRQALTFGSLFGFVVSYSFLWFNNTDIKSPRQVLALIILIILPALFGLLCGLAMAWLGWKIRPGIRSKNA